MYLLDTNICIYAMKNKYPALTDKLLSVRPDDIHLSAVTVSELEFEASKSNWGEKNHMQMHMFISSFTTLPFTYQDALMAGKLRAFLETKGTLVGPYDLLIAAQGISNDLTIVTHNIKEFSRVPGIRLEDWTEE